MALRTRRAPALTDLEKGRMVNSLMANRGYTISQISKKTGKSILELMKYHKVSNPEQYKSESP